MVASRCGYIPCWIDRYCTTLDGSSVYNEVVKKMNKLLKKNIDRTGEDIGNNDIEE